MVDLQHNAYRIFRAENIYFDALCFTRLLLMFGRLIFLSALDKAVRWTAFPPRRPMNQFIGCYGKRAQAR